MTTSPQTEIKDVDFARYFLRALGGNMFVRHEGDLEKVLSSVLDAGAVKNADAVDWAQTAERLLDGLDALIPDDGNKAAARELSEFQRGYIIDVITEIGANEGKVPATMAAQLMALQVKDSNNPDKRQSFYEYLIMSGQEHGGFDTQYSSSMMDGLVETVKRSSPILADDVEYARHKGSAVAEGGPSIGNAQDSLAFGFKVVTRGEENAIAAFWGMPSQDNNGRAVRYNNYSNPLNVSGDDGLRAFLDGSMDRGGYDMGQGGPAFERQSFDSMIVDRWVEGGVLSSRDDDARADFIQYASNRIAGARIDGQFLESMLAQDKLDFGGMSAAESARFKAAFNAHMADFEETLDINNKSSHIDAADRALVFIRDYPADVNFKGLDYAGYARTYPHLDPMTMYDGVRNDMAEILNDYRRVHDPYDFAAEIRDFADRYDGVKLGIGGASSYEPSTTLPLHFDQAASGVVVDAPAVDVAQVRTGSRPEAFNECAADKVDVPCAAPDNDLKSPVKALELNQSYS